MGSYSSSSSYNASSTSYANTPVTQEGDNPNSLLNSSGNNVLTDSTQQNLSVGGSMTTLDGGAIAKAFDFGSQLVGIVADITRQSNNAAQSQSAQALAGVLDATKAGGIDGQAKAADWMQNKTLIYAAAVVAVAFFFFRK